MKLALLILSLNAFANFYPVGREGAKTVYTKKALCEQQEGRDCYDITGKSPEYLSAEQVTEDDVTKPLYLDGYNTLTCDSQVDCATRMDEVEECNSGDRKVIQKNSLMPGFKIVCTRIIGYEQKTSTKLVEDAQKKSEFEAKQKALSDESAARAKVFRAMSFGKELKADIAIINTSRNLTENQTKQFVNEFVTVNRLLDAGAISTARSEVSGLTPDGTILREQDKTIILEKIDAFLASVNN